MKAWPPCGALGLPSMPGEVKGIYNNGWPTSEPGGLALRDCNYLVPAFCGVTARLQEANMPGIKAF